jgi:hypothetical protein
LIPSQTQDEPIYFRTSSRPFREIRICNDFWIPALSADGRPLRAVPGSVGLRWDPDEAKRHARQWRAPTKEPPTTQHAASRLAIIGLSVLTCAPVASGSRVRLSVVGGAGSGDRFNLAWPIWKIPASLSGIRALLSHPRLREPGALDHLGVDHLRVSRRISLERLRNFTAAEPVAAAQSGRPPGTGPAERAGASGSVPVAMPGQRGP